MPTQAEGKRLAQLLVDRIEARRDIKAYARMMEIPGVPQVETGGVWRTQLAAHHDLILTHAQAACERDNGRLMVMAPPGSAKSSYISVVLPTWLMGRTKGTRLVLTGYSDRPVQRQSRRAREICRNAFFASLFATRLVDDAAGISDWTLQNGSEILAAGMYSGITGSRADFLVIDDPVSGREEADSKAAQERCIDTYHDDLLSRAKPGCSVIIVQTRWNENDLSGRILPEDWAGESGVIRCRDGLDWDVLCIPALCDRPNDPLGRKIGQYMWPEYFTRDHWKPFESNPRTWSSLYQQVPAPDQGIYFRREDFQWYRIVPERLRTYMASDFAVTASGDYTEHGVFGIDEHGLLYVIDWWSGRGAPDVTIPPALELIRRHRVGEWFGERGVIESSIGPSVIRAMRDRSTFVRRSLLPTVGDKVAKCRGFMGRVGAHAVYVPDVDWAEALVEQLVRFPAARYDDKVDVCGMIGRALDELRDADPAKRPRPVGIKPFSREWLWYGNRKPQRKRF